MKKLLFIFFLIIAFMASKANNVQITNVSFVSTNFSIKFDISWENSWRSSVLNNWDAAYVFFKYKLPNGSWSHVNLSGIGGITPVGFSRTMISDNGLPIGAMFYRSSASSGTSTLTNVELGLSTTQIGIAGLYDMKAFGIEMVYCPSGSFTVGDGDYTNGGVNAVVQFTGYYMSTSPTTTFFGPSYPSGYDGFYCMKYELSQGGYRDFLNTLSYDQQVNHIVAAPSAIAGTAALYNLNRNSIKIKTPGVSSATPAVFGCDADGDGIFDEINDGETIACNFLNWPDHAAYLAWAGLRPLSEFEFEKAARGYVGPVNAEYAWGSTQIGLSIFTLSNPNLTSESVTNSSTTLGNANFTNTYPNAPYNGPLRNGIFATATSDRVTSGGGFYGIMELSGNLWERVLTYNNPAGLSSSTTPWPSQNLDANGYAVAAASGWPGTTSNIINGIANANGLIYRGGGWDSPLARLEISDRAGLQVINTNTDRTTMFNVGVRGCVTIP